MLYIGVYAVKLHVHMEMVHVHMHMGHTLLWCTRCEIAGRETLCSLRDLFLVLYQDITKQKSPPKSTLTDPLFLVFKDKEVCSSMTYMDRNDQVALCMYTHMHTYMHSVHMPTN